MKSKLFVYLNAISDLSSIFHSDISALISSYLISQIGDRLFSSSESGTLYGIVCGLRLSKSKDSIIYELRALSPNEFPKFYTFARKEALQFVKAHPNAQQLLGVSRGANPSKRRPVIIFHSDDENQHWMKVDFCD